MKRTLSTIIFLFAAITLMAQNSFIVTDKNGNSQLVQSLIFQQDANNDRFSWNTNNDANGYQQTRDIKDLLFIARTKKELATGSAEEVINALEGLAGTDNADAKAVAVALQSNPNVVEAFSEDGDNVCVKMENGGGYTMYPMYELQSAFDVENIPLPTEEALSRSISSAKKASTRERGNVAIFNFFEGKEDRYLHQNLIVGHIKSKFEAHNYHVDYFGKKNDGEEKIFTQDNFEDVIRKSSQYTAIIIMTHGGLGEYGKSWIATRDVPKDDDRYTYVEPVENREYRMIPVEESLRDVNSKCIVYIGACNGVPKGGFEKYPNAFPHNTKACAIGWEGKNCIAQAHAVLLFHYLLYNGFNVVEALKGLPEKDPKYYYSQRHFSNYGGSTILDAEEELRPKYSKATRADFKADQVYIYNKKDYSNAHYALKVTGNWYSSEEQFVYRIIMKDALSGYEAQKKLVLVNREKNGKIDITWDDLSNIHDGAYEVYMDMKERDGWRRVRMSVPAPIIISQNFSDLYALPVLQDNQVAPKILGNDGQPTDEITLPVGTSNNFTIDGYRGHTYKTVSLDPDIATVSVSGSTLTITGVSEGSTFIGVEDEQNKEIAIAEVIVNQSGETPDASIITFEDPKVKAICVANWDTNGEGELSKDEAAAVTDLGRVFKENKEITSFNELQFFTGLTAIGDSSFCVCSGLTYITIPNSVTSIGESAFYGCSGLTSITIPNSVTSIGKYAFFLCSGLTSIVIENENTVNDSRDNCNAILHTATNKLIAGFQNTIIPKTVTSIGDEAFSGCSGLTSITIPNSVTSIGSYAFYGCSGLTSITIPNSVTNIGDGAFCDCSGLTSITIPNSVTSIGESAFRDCSGLTSITIPNSVTSIGGSAFSGCSGLTSITIPNSVTSIGNYAFWYCSGLTSVTIPNSVTSIGRCAFYYCRGLTSITIPNSVTSIGESAFDGCTGLTSVTIPNSVTSIGRQAFAACRSLEKVVSYIYDPFEIYPNVFHAKPADATLYVPAGTKAKYEATEGWNEFKIIVEM